MILYEFESKDLLRAHGLMVPPSCLLRRPEDSLAVSFPCVLKAQVLSGKRAAVDGVLFGESEAAAKKIVREMLGREINHERVEAVLVEEKIPFTGGEYYLSFSYTGEGPIVTFLEKGGADVEGRSREAFSLPVSPAGSHLERTLPLDGATLSELANLFFEEDCLLLELNPLVKSARGWMALDAKIKLDDDAFSRHKERNFLPRAVPGHRSTTRETAAKMIDKGDYRGTAGSTYFDLEGDIAVLASGGGASLTAMDALIKAGGRPANYTEYSGNPSREKVARLTEIVLSKPDLRGLWVVGAVANFTDIHETMTGFLEGLRATGKNLKTALDFPILIRRGGPRDKEAFAMLRATKDFDLHLYGPETSITRSAEIMVNLAGKYVERF